MGLLKLSTHSTSIPHLLLILLLLLPLLLLPLLLVQRVNNWDNSSPGSAEAAAQAALTAVHFLGWAAASGSILNIVELWQPVKIVQ
jgi:hypothetical protein